MRGMFFNTPGSIAVGLTDDTRARRGGHRSVAIPQRAASAQLFAPSMPTSTETPSNDKTGG